MPEKKEYMKAIKLDGLQIQRRAFKPEPAYRQVVESLHKQIVEMFQNPGEKLRISCCIEGCCVSWCCIQIS